MYYRYVQLMCYAVLIHFKFQAPPDVMLKLHGNGVRRARWDAKLGYMRNPQPPPLPISSLFPTGGIVGCLDVVITRVYPVQVIASLY